MKTIIGLGLTLWFALFSILSWAHHGYPQYNLRESSTLSGTILSYRMSNPHSHMTLSVANEGGETEIWAIETLDTLRGMRSKGFSADTLQVGDLVTMTVSPALNGDRTAVFRSVEFEDGRIMPAPEEN
jgi:hypothetical protein